MYVLKVVMTRFVDVGVSKLWGSCSTPEAPRFSGKRQLSQAITLVTPLTTPTSATPSTCPQGTVEMGRSGWGLPLHHLSSGASSSLATQSVALEFGAFLFNTGKLKLTFLPLLGGNWQVVNVVS